MRHNGEKIGVKRCPSEMFARQSGVGYQPRRIARAPGGIDHGYRFLCHMTYCLDHLPHRKTVAIAQIVSGARSAAYEMR